ncbi:hypothetical protein NQD34_018224 [Periophthalmus magnuspinnatus]|nr:hypothetical protein NQD34_018224 [Periophthalmus magnuspinnatus]
MEKSVKTTFVLRGGGQRSGREGTYPSRERRWGRGRLEEEVQSEGTSGARLFKWKCERKEVIWGKRDDLVLKGSDQLFKCKFNIYIYLQDYFLSFKHFFLNFIHALICIYNSFFKI